MKRILHSLFVAFLFVAFKPSDTKTITGIVTDKMGGIPGVYIVTDVSKKAAATDKNGKYSITVSEQDTELSFNYIGYKTQTIKIGNKSVINILLQENENSLTEVTVSGYGSKTKEMSVGSSSSIMIRGVNNQQFNTESYRAINENGFHTAKTEPLSTFSIDVDAASYSNVRRFINNGALPPADAVRIEEMINYFDYEYPQPTGNDPVNIITEMANAPWNPQHKLVQIGLQGKTIATDNLPPSNLVFLIDVSGSMNQPNKLPLLVSSFKLLTDQLRDKDKIAIVVYAGNSGLVLPSTPGDDKETIKNALNKLHASGSTGGGAGLKLAYKVAADNFVKGGNNRVILATDGDFNVGASSDAEMQHLIEQERQSGIFLTVLGYGMGNYKDSKMETLADKGNGNYAYIDNITEARKILVNEFGGSLFTLAKDVKLQIEFNPNKVQAYRLIGYENRLLNKEDFNDDKKDAGELGSGHTVTALYEIIPVGIKSKFIRNVDDLKYQKPAEKKSNNLSDELLTVKLRYKQPNGSSSKLLSKSVPAQNTFANNTSNNFRFAAAVAEFGFLLRNSEYKQNATFDELIALAENAKGKDKEGYRSEFIKLVKSAKLMAKDLLSSEDKRKTNEEN